jgi:hypothetical protein
MTIYQFAVQEEQRYRIKQIHKYTCDYLLDFVCEHEKKILLNSHTLNFKFNESKISLSLVTEFSE